MDRLLGELLALLDEETLLVIVSDHSGTGSAQPLLDVRKVFEQAGLLSYTTDSATGMKKIDWSRTKAFPQRSIHVYLNLKGRDPQGTVEPADYDRVVDEVIQAMMDYKDPATGKHPFSLVLRKEDAALLGLWGDRIGDIIYAVRPEYDMEHGSELPTARVGELTIRSLFFMKGPNVKKGLHLQRLVQLTAVSPTIAHLMGFPIPAQAEGAVLWEALEDPDFRLNQVQALRKELDRWKKLYAGLAVEYDLNPRPEIEE
jgi:predicted AlkP superfamily phosphohydrolase/phosphomutase